MKYFFSAFLLPPFPLIALMVICWLVRGRNQRAGSILLALGAAGSIIMSMPATGKLVILPLLNSVKPWTPDGALRPDVIVIPTAGAFEDLGGRWWPISDTIRRLSSGLLLRQTLGLPLIISGGPMVEGHLSEAAIAARLFALQEGPGIRLEQHSRNSYEAAARVAELLRPTGAEVVLLVTTDLHMARMAASLRHQGIGVVGKPVRRPDYYQYTWSDAVPTNFGLTIWRYALTEYAAIAWYLASGKISAADLVP